MSLDFKPGVFFGEPILIVPITATKEEIMQSTHDVLLSLVSREMAESGCSISQSKKTIAAELAAVAGADPATVTLREAPRPMARVISLSERTKEIMLEKKLSFAQAQRLASVEYRGVFLSRGR